VCALGFSGFSAFFHVKTHRFCNTFTYKDTMIKSDKKMIKMIKDDKSICAYACKYMCFRVGWFLRATHVYMLRFPSETC
jgi:hypothetical protein